MRDGEEVLGFGSARAGTAGEEPWPWPRRKERDEGWPGLSPGQQHDKVCSMTCSKDVLYHCLFSSSVIYPFQ